MSTVVRNHVFGAESKFAPGSMLRLEKGYFDGSNEMRYRLYFMEHLPEHSTPTVPHFAATGVQVEYLRGKSYYEVLDIFEARKNSEDPSQPYGE